MHTRKTATDILNTQTNANESTQEPYSIQTNEQFKDTILWIRGNDDTGYFATIGDFKITETYESIPDLTKRLNKTDLKLIQSIFTAMIETRLNPKFDEYFKNLQNENNNSETAEQQTSAEPNSESN